MLPRAVVLLGWALVGPLVFAACSDGAVPSTPPNVTPTVIRAYEPDAAEAGVMGNLSEGAPAPSADAATPVVYQGNPLCHASHADCYPDDMIDACHFPPPSAAAALDAGTDANVNAAPACHVVSDGGLHTACLPSTVAGMYASTCAHSEDCAPGYECVAGGTCRHYCCSGNSACTDYQFCDQQPMAESPSTLVPVCLTEDLCTLLNDSTCPPSEQCAVVRDDGATSCVDVGTAMDGQACDQEHCARGLVCLGAVGSRRCEPLCYTADPKACTTTGRTCIGTLPLFPNPLVGVCQ